MSPLFLRLLKTPMAKIWLVGILSMVLLSTWLVLSGLMPVVLDLKGQYIVSEGIENGSSEATFVVAKGAVFPLLGFGVKLEPSVRYRACLPILRASARTSVVVDVSGGGYDSPAQEHRFDVAKKSTPKNYCFEFDSESPPADTGLRVMFDGVGGAMPGSLEFARPVLEKIRQPALLDASWFAALISLAVFMFFAAGKLVEYLLRHGATVSLDRVARLAFPCLLERKLFSILQLQLSPQIFALIPSLTLLVSSLERVVVVVRYLFSFLARLHPSSRRRTMAS